MNKEKLRSDQFELYDLAVVVEKIDGNCTCNMKVGDCFHVKGGKLFIPAESGFCLYAIQATMPLLPAKQRKGHPADWMETDARVVCPDPACALVMRIDRTGTRIYSHDEVSAIPMPGHEGDSAS